MGGAATPTACACAPCRASRALAAVAPRLPLANPHTRAARPPRPRRAALHLSVLPIVALAGLFSAAYLRLRTFPAPAGAAPKRAAFAAVFVFCALGYALNLAPYLSVKRSTFIYHYMPALLYAQLLTAVAVDWFAGPQWRGVAVRAYAVLVGAVFLFNYPWIYAFAVRCRGGGGL